MHAFELSDGGQCIDPYFGFDFGGNKCDSLGSWDLDFGLRLVKKIRSTRTSALTQILIVSKLIVVTFIINLSIQIFVN